MHQEQLAALAHPAHQESQERLDPSDTPEHVDPQDTEAFPESWAILAPEVTLNCEATCTERSYSYDVIGCYSL